jgi:hypothetical protein
VTFRWSRLGDVAVHENKLLGIGIQNSSVNVWVVDLSRREGDLQVGQRPFTSPAGDGGTPQRQQRHTAASAPVATDRGASLNPLKRLVETINVVRA